MKRIPVGFGKDRNRFDTELPAASNHSDRYFAAVGYE
jgi:hypothetical protein